MSIHIAQSDIEIQRCFPVLVQLRPHLQAEEFIEKIRRQQQTGYLIAYLEGKEQVQAVAGFRVYETLGYNKILYIDDLVTDEDSRSLGYGQHLLQWLGQYAQEQDCSSLHLDSGVHRAGAHRFYFRQGMMINSFHFQLVL